MLWSLVLRYRVHFALLIGCSIAAVVAMHFWLPLYEGSASLVFETASSSSLQAVSAKLGTLGLQEDEGRELDRYTFRLNTSGFYKQVAVELRKMNVDLPMFHKEMLSPKRRILWNLAKLFHLPVPESSLQDLSDDEMADILDSYVYFNRMGNDRINVVVRSGDRKSASIVANVIADMSVKVLRAEGLQDLDESQSYIELQVKESEKAIRDIEDSLARLKLAKGIVMDAGGTMSEPLQATGIQHQLSEATIEYEENAQRIGKLEEELKREKERDGSILNANIDPDNRYGLPRKISELRRANELVSIKQGALKKLLSEILHSDNQNDEQKIFDLHKRMEFEYSIYQELRKQAFQIEMRRIGARNKMRVFEHAREAEVQRSDNLFVKMAIALILSIFGGLPVAMIWDLARPRARSGKDLSDAGMAFLGAIPALSGRFINEKRTQNARICRFDTDSEVAMAFIQIRSRLLYLSDQKDVRAQVIAVVSAKPGEGKSYFSRNLAACFGHMGRRTLLIDCDLRKVLTSEYFGHAQAPGLGEVLTGTRKFGEVVKRGVARGLDFIPAGQVRTNITDLFANDSLDRLFGDLREVYDLIICDTPSLIAVPDAPLITRAADLPLLIASMNDTTQQDLEVSLDRIRSLHPGEIYAVLNRVSGGQVPLYVIHSGARRAREESSHSLGGGAGGGA
jgi:capsular exopolysaccharide synthesis family protein